jgi:CheY-like chemotaxis protein
MAPMKTVLLADDCPLARRLLGRRLDALGIANAPHDSCASACEAADFVYACAVLDLDLGDGTGLQVAEALRARDPSLPIAFFTGGADEGPVERALEHGPVFSKPLDIERVIEWVREATRVAAE